MKKQKKILIVGGGIASLTLAGNLRNNEAYNIRLLEKQEQWPTSGTGIYIPANGVTALEEMGLGTIVRQKGAVINQRYVLSDSGKMIMKLDLTQVWKRKEPCLGISRKALHEVLLEGLSGVNITHGLSINKLTLENNHVDVEFSDNGNDLFDLVIGADGLNSKTRELILGKTPLRKVTSQVCRFITGRPEGINDWTLFAGKTGQFLILPIDKDTVYCYVNRNTEETISQNKYMDPFQKFADPIPEILKSWKPENAFWDDLAELSPLQTMGHKSVVLIGDAAHGMPPYMAQGGSLAIEDALVLKHLLNINHDWTDMAGQFTRSRNERINWVRARNRKREKLTKLPIWLTKSGLRLVGKKTWTEDYRPLVDKPEWS